MYINAAKVNNYEFQIRSLGLTMGMVSAVVLHGIKLPVMLLLPPPECALVEQQRIECFDSVLQKWLCEGERFWPSNN